MEQHVKNKDFGLLPGVQQTLFLPVWARATESRRKEPLLADKKSVDIMESIGFDTQTLKQNLREISRISWIARCVRYDRVTAGFVKRFPYSTIVNIGCGLDTSFERLNNSSINWIDIDLPEVIELRRLFFLETQKRRFIASSVFDYRWIMEIPTVVPVLFLFAGVLMYFEKNQVRQLFSIIADHFPGAELFFDVTSRHGIKAGNKVIRQSRVDEKDLMKWAVNDVNEIMKWDSRLELKNRYHTFRVSGLNLSPPNKLLAAVSDLLGIQVMVHIKIREE